MAPFLGIDVCCLSLDALVRPQGMKIHVSNDPAGFEELQRSLSGHSIWRVLLEATGSYERDDDLRRLRQAQSTVVTDFLKADLKHFKSQIKRVEQEIAQQTEKLNDKRVAQLVQVKGIGMVTAGKLVTLLPELGRVESREKPHWLGWRPSTTTAESP
ncbi:hypothetical protein M2J80_14975 [Pseudomonas sp. NY11382]|nr:MULTISPECIES: hypothetical protein [Pseudomonas]WBM30883.1 hypothetical protein M2J80_14975 [Pseudomonas sp. NY11382]